jgi:hypothetical protein
MTNSGISVGNLNVELESSLNDLLSCAIGNRVTNFGSVSPVVHQEHLKVGDVVDQKSVEVVGSLVLGLLVGTISNLHERTLALEATAHSAVNTLGRPPSFLKKG